MTQAPEDGQNYNRYTYANNNPLKYTDPSGYAVDKKFVCTEGCYAPPGSMEYVSVVGTYTPSPSVVGNQAALAFSVGASSVSSMNQVMQENFTYSIVQTAIDSGAVTAVAQNGDLVNAQGQVVLNAAPVGSESVQKNGSCSGQMCRSHLYGKNRNNELFQNADLSVDGQICAGPCIGGELDVSKDYGTTTTIKSGFGLRASGGAGFDITIVNFGDVPVNGDLTTINYFSGQLGPAGITINHYAWPEGSQWNFELNLRYPGGFGANGGTGMKQW